MGLQNKNSDIDDLETHLGILGSKIRIRVLKYLAKNTNGVEFKSILREISAFSSDNPNLSFHLNKLREFNYILKTDRGYQLTSFGQRCYNQLDKLSEIVLEKAPIKIRTSRYTLEPFDEKIIAQRLMEEANVPPRIADEIAKKAKKRLLEAKITYLTSPLIREFINAILIENQYEDFRHKLTRLGVPPYDIKQIVHSKVLTDTQQLRNRLGKKTLEQFVLLDNLSQKSADDYLSGKFLLTDLEHFGFTPLELVISGTRFWQAIVESSEIHERNADFENISFSRLCILMREFFALIQPFFTKGITIYRFDGFLEHFFEEFEKTDLSSLFYELLAEPHKNPGNEGFSINIGISLQANYADIEPLLDLYLESLNQPPAIWTTFPHLQVHFTKPALQDLHRITESRRKQPIIKKIITLLHTHHISIDQPVIRGEQEGEQIFSNLGVPIYSPSATDETPGIVVEKISLNIYEIYKDLIRETSYSEKMLFNRLETAIFSIFNYFEDKCQLLNRNIGNFQHWAIIVRLLFNQSNPFQTWKEISKYQGKTPIFNAISIHGLSELIYAQSGYFNKDIQKNREFTVKVYDFVEKLLKKQNKTQNPSIKFVLSESHYQKELIHPKSDILSDLYDKPSENDTDVLSDISYKLGFYANKTSVAPQNLEMIYGDLAKMKFPFLSASINHIPAQSSSDFAVQVQLIQTIFKIGICNLSINQNRLNYLRFHQQYFPEPEK